MSRVEFVTEKIGDNPLMTLDVGGRRYNVRFVLIVPSKRRVVLPILHQGEQKTIDFKLIVAGGCVVMTQKYSTVQTINKRRDNLTGELITTKRETEYNGWSAIKAVLQREGLGTALENITEEAIKNLARQAITSNLFNSLGKDTVLIQLCTSNLLERKERSEVDPKTLKWTLYHPALIIPVSKAIYNEVKAKGYNYSGSEIGALTSILDIGEG